MPDTPCPMPPATLVECADVVARAPDVWAPVKDVMDVSVDTGGVKPVDEAVTLGAIVVDVGAAVTSRWLSQTVNSGVSSA